MEINIQKAFRKSDRVKLDTGRGLTEQAHKQETDMNYILRDYQAKGIVRHVNKYEGRYDDVEVGDFQEAMFIVKNAENMFNELPSGVRKRFKNDIPRFLEFVQDPGNKEELQKMKLLKGNDGIDRKGKKVSAPVPDPEAPPLEQT